jgi:hypothetical protein
MFCPRCNNLQSIVVNQLPTFFVFITKVITPLLKIYERMGRVVKGPLKTLVDFNIINKGGMVKPL